MISRSRVVACSAAYFQARRPFRRARVIADTLAQLNIVELDHGAVGLESESVTDAVEFIDRREDLLGRTAYFRPLMRPLAERFQPIQNAFLGRGNIVLFADLTETKGDELERAPRDEARVQELERTGSGIARIGEGLLAGGAHLIAEPRKA